MCRLFAMSAAPRRVSAEFWLAQAPDSLIAQSRREPDGWGVGTFDANGRAHRSRSPGAAYRDPAFRRDAGTLRSATFLAHVRFASTGALVLRNTHPFEMEGRLMAHNGVVQGLAELERQVGPAMAEVHGDTDSERLFALITAETRRHGGDVGAGIVAAARWAAEHLPLLSINLIVSTASRLWALRYPETHRLYVLERAAAVDHHSSVGLRVRSPEMAVGRSVVIASERLDEDPGWRELRSGELIHVDETCRVTSETVLDGPPAHPLTLADLEGRAARSQA